MYKYGCAQMVLLLIYFPLNVFLCLILHRDNVGTNLKWKVYSMYKYVSLRSVCDTGEFSSWNLDNI